MLRFYVWLQSQYLSAIVKTAYASHLQKDQKHQTSSNPMIIHSVIPAKAGIHNKLEAFAMDSR
ncbi:MAG: hypothetical protein HGB11_02665 [Chlorobiales bacterium]|nr:hypothetical protein [Chlorobiales bacterium]